MNKVGGKLLVTAVVKDNARTVERALRRLARLKGSFEELAFAVYENNSTDGTKEIVGRLASELEPFALLSEDLSPERQAEIATARHKSGGPCRIELIAYARERARADALRAFPDYDYVLTFDADAVWLSLEGVRRNAGRLARGEADCVCANGMTKWLKYRDAFAYRGPDHPFGPEYLGEFWWEKTVGRIQRRLGGSALLPVYSAFGGAALLSMAAYRAGRYGAIPDREYQEIQASLDSSAAPADERERASALPLPNTNYSRPIVCEHVPFCYALRKRGLGRVFVDPAWRALFLD